MKLDKLWIKAADPRIVRAVLAGITMAVAIALLVAPKPWETELKLPSRNLEQCIRFSLWWAELVALPVLGVLALTARQRHYS